MIQAKNLMIVAHPDDETIFGYSQLREGDWYVVSVTNGDHPVRSREFGTAMDALGLKHEMWAFKDEWGGGFDPYRVGQWVRDLMGRGNFQKVVTHNGLGEYGHTQHSSLHVIVKENVPRSIFYTFNPDGTQYLPFQILAEKLKILECYASQKQLGLFEWYDQTKPENCMMKYVVHEGIRKDET